MDRNAVYSIVVGYLRKTIVDLDESNINPKQSMLAMGATSLDIVEIVSVSMRNLGVKVPRAALAELKCLDDLVDLLFRAVQEQKVAMAARA
jgi:acyl carrier protein